MLAIEVVVEIIHALHLGRSDFGSNWNPRAIASLTSIRAMHHFAFDDLSRWARYCAPQHGHKLIASAQQDVVPAYRRAGEAVNDLG